MVSLMSRLDLIESFQRLRKATLKAAFLTPRMLVATSAYRFLISSGVKLS